MSNFDRSWNHLSPQQREQLSASFRHTPTPSQFAAADSGWAREYLPTPLTQPGLRAQNKVSVQHAPNRMSLPMQQANRGLYGMSIGTPLHRPDMVTHGMGGAMDTMGVRVGPELHNYGPVIHQSQNAIQQNQSSSADMTNWDTAFTAYDRPVSPIQAQMTTEALPINQARGETNSNDADQLARTAGRLVSTVEHETNSKFKQSNFLNLMRKIRDKQAGIEGKDIVERLADEQSASSPSISLDKGKGREDWSDQFRQKMGRSPTSQYEAVEWARQKGILHSSSSSSSRGPLQMAPGPTSFASELEGREMLNEMWAEEDAKSEAIEKEAMKRAFIGDGGNVDQRRREDAVEFAKYQRILGTDRGSVADAVNKSSMEEEFDELQSQDFVGRDWQGRMGKGVNGAQSQEWDTLQKNWDAWQADSAGLVPSMEAPSSAASAPQYRFHAVNPYVGAATTTTTNSSYANNATSFLPTDMQSVLEREAAVQRDPTNASAWLDLGVKQQENEREGLAIAALHRAIQLDPTLRDAWLALAVSYTNENDRMAAFEAIERWIEATPQYSAIVKQHRGGDSNQKGSKANQSFSERHERLSNQLIALARHGSMQNEIDADVQVALGVLFNASEDYDKAVDCFTAALQVRPDDWLLYNRLGATLSNSGRSEEALRYYHQALDLRPGFVRCHFNLSISCLNLKLYQDAASHIYTALTLQSESFDDDHHDQQRVNQLDASTNNGGGVTSSSLWETLRIACELMNRPELASLTKERDLNRFDPLDFGFGMDQDQKLESTLEPTM